MVGKISVHTIVTRWRNGRFVTKLKDTTEPTGDGNMLDNTFAMHGSASSSFHLSRNYPIVSAGGKTLLHNGRYLQYVNLLEDGSLPAGVISDSGWRGTAKEEDQPLAHLFVTILQRLGVETDTFAGSRGGLNVFEPLSLISICPCLVPLLEKVLRH